MDSIYRTSTPIEEPQDVDHEQDYSGEMYNFDLAERTTSSGAAQPITPAPSHALDIASHTDSQSEYEDWQTIA